MRGTLQLRGYPLAVRLAVYIGNQIHVWVDVDEDGHKLFRVDQVVDCMRIEHGPPHRHSFRKLAFQLFDKSWRTDKEDKIATFNALLSPLSPVRWRREMIVTVEIHFHIFAAVSDEEVGQVEHIVGEVFSLRGAHERVVAVENEHILGAWQR